MVGAQNWIATLSVNGWALAFSILGAFGILSLVSDVIIFEAHIGAVIGVWQDFTRSLMDILFGWIFRLFGVEFPWWAKDYLTMCFVAAGMLARTYIKVNGSVKDAADGFREQWRRNLVFILAWPYPFYIGIRKIFAETPDLDRKGFLIYFETVAWAMLVIGINAALVIAGAPTVQLG